jgi:hypothetical protein
MRSIKRKEGNKLGELVYNSRMVKVERCIGCPKVGAGEKCAILRKARRNFMRRGWEEADFTCIRNPWELVIMTLNSVVYGVGQETKK